MSGFSGDLLVLFFFFKQKTAYEMRISDWSSDVCSSDLAIHERGGVVVVDPRRTETARRFEHVAVRPDSDAWLLAAMLNHIFARELEARELLETRTAGWTDLRAALRPLTPEVAAGRCGIAPGTIRALAERFVRARTSEMGRAPCRAKVCQ